MPGEQPIPTHHRAAMWRSRGYDSGSSSGLICLACGSVVGQIELLDGRYAWELHDEWHAKFATAGGADVPRWENKPGTEGGANGGA